LQPEIPIPLLHARAPHAAAIDGRVSNFLPVSVVASRPREAMTPCFGPRCVA
jgi:hypothetical protein